MGSRGRLALTQEKMDFHSSLYVEVSRRIYFEYNSVGFSYDLPSLFPLVIRKKFALCVLVGAEVFATTATAFANAGVFFFTFAFSPFWRI